MNSWIRARYFPLEKEVYEVAPLLKPSSASA